MNAIEIIILISALALVAFTVLYNILKRKKGKSCGCGGCAEAGGDGRCDCGCGRHAPQDDEKKDGEI
ncbi:MAG: hypothetical protein LBQ27_06285 [Clostridiales bacterium]|jgi:hypothetical protein|nr:hypothetical protein [Clostridiales bacterium]